MLHAIFRFTLESLAYLSRQLISICNPKFNQEAILSIQQHLRYKQIRFYRYLKLDQQLSHTIEIIDGGFDGHLPKADWLNDFFAFGSQNWQIKNNRASKFQENLMQNIIFFSEIEIRFELA